MTEPASDSPANSAMTTVKPLRCFLGSVVAGGLGFLLYRLFSAIALTFANKPIASSNVTAVNISAAVRTLVMGIVALGAGVFGVAALGLFALGIQISLQRLRGDSSAGT
ncbi:MAG: DUF3082 domain-containing protein [Leptolyngbya sp. SIO4C5]|uniref:DUF3082 domain-containing protein n=1 Tax=Sphaerothrix gracilis TaxID=3151835 RepID=UPI0013C0341C|nr:DUF3082 domain-containing protein [Leptolyngbya sp. SIO4C5]